MKPKLKSEGRLGTRGTSAGFYQKGGHGDVEELSSPALRDGSGEEKLVSIFGEERRFILRRQKTAA